MLQMEETRLKRTTKHVAQHSDHASSSTALTVFSQPSNNAGRGNHPRSNGRGSRRDGNRNRGCNNQRYYQFSKKKKKPAILLEILLESTIAWLLSSVAESSTTVMGPLYVITSTLPWPTWTKATDTSSSHVEKWVPAHNWFCGCNQNDDSWRPHCCRLVYGFRSHQPSCLHDMYPKF